MAVFLFVLLLPFCIRILYILYFPFNPTNMSAWSIMGINSHILSFLHMSLLGKIDYFVRIWICLINGRIRISRHFFKKGTIFSVRIAQLFDQDLDNISQMKYDLFRNQT